MKIEIDDNKIRIRGKRGVDILIYADSLEEGDKFMFSICYDSMEYGVLPMVQVYGKKNIVISNSLKSGRFIFNDREYESTFKEIS